MKKLTAREEAFVVAFMGPARGNASQAAIQAGYKKGRGLRTTASRLLTKANIAQAIATFKKKRETKSIATAQERDEIFSAIVRDETLELHARIAAGKELNKCEGRHTLKHVVDLSESLVEIVARSRRA